MGNQSVEAGIAIALPVAAAGQVLTVFARTITIFFQHAADKYAREANFRMIDVCHITALAVQALRVAIPVLLVSVFVSPEGVKALLGKIPEVVTGGLAVSGGIIVVVGYAMVLNMMSAKYLMPFFFLGFVIAAFTEFNLVAFGVMGAIFALIYVQLNPKFSQTPVLQPAEGSAGIDDELDDELD